MMIRKTTSIALKLFALYLIFSVLVSLPTIVASSWHLANLGEATPAAAVYAAIVLVPTLVLAAIAIWLLWKVANSIAPKTKITATDATSLDLDKLYQYALSLMGLFFALNALLALPSQWLTMKTFDGPSVISTYSMSFAATVARFFLGCFLIAKPRQWANWLKRIGETKNSQQ